MQKYKEINGNDYVKNSRTTINETMQSIQSMNSGTAFPTNNLFEGMKCYRTDLKKTYTLTDVENNTWVEDAHATLSDEATHAASATKLDTARALNLGGAVTADAATFDGTANATINVKTLDATKLKGTASVSTTGNAATATKVVATAAAGASANIAEATMASNDLARIRVSGATNAGELALETADDGSEPIVARQYTGIYETPVRTAKILDESGNTSFPGTVVAPKFTGTLNGNAATATKLQTPRTLSLTGKAAGSATFDGSANASINVTSVNADTASKLSTARKINITGNATGSATFDGSGDISISTTVNESKHAVNADVAKTLETIDSGGMKRNAQFYWIGQGGQPDWLWGTSDSDVTAYPYKPSNFHVAAANNDGNGANIANTYLKKSGGNMSGPLNFANRTWNLVGDDSYMGDHNIGGTFCVKGANDITGIALINGRNEADYAHISYDGGNINFNRKIAANLAGNADTATHASSADSAADVTNATVSPGVSNINGVTVPASGVIADLSAVTGSNDLTSINKLRSYIGSVYNGNWYNAISIRHRNGETDGTNYGMLIYSNLTYNLDTIHYKKQCSGWTEERTLLDSANYNDYAPTKTGGGASGTWGINISGNAAGLSGDLAFPGIGNTGVSRKITWNGSTDGADIYYQTTESDQGNLVFNLRDDQNCYLRIAANGAFKSYFSPSDGNFHGNVNGRADSAGNADTVDGYHASDLLSKITAANTGGIVAASLTENGYAKFANGLILQWGTRTEPKVDDWVWVTTTFPITFASACFSVTCCDELTSTYDGDVESFVRNIKTNSVDIRYRSDHLGRNLRWLALGV